MPLWAVLTVRRRAANKSFSAAYPRPHCIIPKVEDARAYLAAPNRERLIDQLLASDDFNVWWGRFLLEQTTDRRAVNFDDEYNGRLLFDWFKESFPERKRKRPLYSSSN